MKNNKNKDYTKLTAVCAGLGIVPCTDTRCQIIPGFYELKPYNAPIDLTACGEDEISILKTALYQFSKQADDDWHNAIEKSFMGDD